MYDEILDLLISKTFKHTIPFLNNIRNDLDLCVIELLEKKKNFQEEEREIRTPVTKVPSIPRNA